MDPPTEHQSSPPILRPLPRRPFAQHSPSSTPSSDPSLSHPSTPRLDLPSQSSNSDDKSDISRNRSIANLTSSTLFGIYAPSFTDSSQPPTPWGTGAETPVQTDSIDGLPSPRGGSEIEARLLRGGDVESPLRLRAGSPSSPLQHHAPKSAANIALRALLRVVLLFCFGLAYGGLIAHLHDNRNMAPVRMEGLNRASWRYLAFWGVAGVAMGSLLPWVDGRWGDRTVANTKSRETPSAGGLNSVEWNDVVRSVGAFVGVAFAIRKLPWSSPLQLTATLTLVNPFLWYLLDRTPAGLTLSSLIGILGTSTILAINPTLIPAPTDTYTLSSAARNTTIGGAQGNVGGELGDVTIQQVGVATWIASVLFCACVCFGSVGRLVSRSSSPSSSSPHAAAGKGER